METKQSYLPYLIAKCNDSSIQKIKAKAILSDTEYPTNRSEYQIKAIKDSQCFLMNHLSDLVDCSLFIKSYYLLSGKRLSETKANRLKYQYYQFKNHGICEVIVELIAEIGHIISFKKVEYALLLMNYFFAKTYGYEIRIPQSRYQEIKTMFRSKTNILDVFLFIKKISKPQNEINQVLDNAEIFSFFGNNRRQLIHTYSIKSLYLFGSRADQTNHSNSDLDLLILFDEKLMSMDAIIKRNEFVAYLKKQLNVEVDLLLFKEAIEGIDSLSLNKLLTIY